MGDMSTPVPFTGRSHIHRRRSKGVSANSRVLPHRYASEGDKGRRYRRLIRRVEKRFWRREAEFDRGHFCD